MLLTSDDILLIFELIEKVYGPGYISDNEQVLRLQGKLSMMLEAKRLAGK